MGIFTRFKDIVSSNINSMLDKAEEPEKMIRLMIREMEDTLVELKATCAGSMAGCKNLGRERDALRATADTWHTRAALAVDKGRDDLAREAIAERRRWEDRANAVDEELAQAEALVAQAQEDIGQLEDKLRTAKEKQRLLAQRHTRARERKRARDDMRRADSTDAVIRFEELEQRIERMEAEATLAGAPKTRRTTLDGEFARLETDSGVENELQAMKAGRASAAKPGEDGA
ncbi:MAG: phage shock protein PspA [Desulfovibrionaceae bacterium]